MEKMGKEMETGAMSEFYKTVVALGGRGGGGVSE